MVKLYSLSTCPWCKKVKQLLDGKAIKYETIEVDLAEGEAQRQALAEVERLTGRRSFPVTVIGETVIQGYKEEELKKALENEA